REAERLILYCIKVNRTSLDHLPLGEYADVDGMSHGASITPGRKKNRAGSEIMPKLPDPLAPRMSAKVIENKRARKYECMPIETKELPGSDSKRGRVEVKAVQEGARYAGTKVSATKDSMLLASCSGLNVVLPARSGRRWLHPASRESVRRSS